MEKLNISNRLKTVASMVKIRRNVADIGCDHGYLSIYMLIEGICSKVIAMDLRKGPLSRASHNVMEYGLADNIELRLSDGLSKLKKNEVETVCIAGMGGPLIIKILENGKPFSLGIKELIISPQSEIYKVREYLCNNGYLVDEEKMIYEDGQYYNILHVVEGLETNKSPVQLKYGECLLRDKNLILYEYLRGKYEKYQHLTESIEKMPDSEGVRNRLAEINSERLLIKEALSRYEM